MGFNCHISDYLNYLKDVVKHCFPNEINLWIGKCTSVQLCSDEYQKSEEYCFVFENMNFNVIYNITYETLDLIGDCAVTVLRTLEKEVKEKYLQTLPLMDRKVRQIAWNKELKNVR
jgi:hypothetical protein